MNVAPQPPFAPGQRADLFGRADQLNSFTRTLYEVGVRRVTPAPLLIVGQRGAGKTSLLNAMVREADRQHFTTLMVDCATDPLPDVTSLSPSDTHGVVVLLDNIHATDHHAVTTLIAALRSASFPSFTVAAALPTVEPWARHTVIGDLPLIDARDLLTVPVLRAGGRWTPEAVDAALDRSRNPEMLNLLATELWALAVEDGSRVIGAHHLDPAWDAVQRRRAPLYNALAAEVTPAEGRLVHALARLGGQAERSMLARLLNTDTAALGMARRSLIAKGVAEPAGHGRLRFSVPGFAEWVADRTVSAVGV